MLSNKRSFELTGHKSQPSRREDAWVVINKLRFLMIACRAESRISIRQACKLIQVNKKKSARLFADSILRTLDQVLGKPPVFRNPGDKDLSFDEKWLASLIRSHLNEDQPSIKFLLSSRIANFSRRSYLTFLLDGLVKDINSL